MIESASFIPLFVGLLLSVAGADPSCPLELSPPSVVVKYGDPVSVNCSTSETLLEGIGWEVTHGATGLQPVKHLTWSLDSLTHWSISPTCFISPTEDSTIEQCSQPLDIVVYTFPDTIYIDSDSAWNGRVKEFKEYDFTCIIPNIAPVQNLTVKWYKGDELLKTDTFENPSKKPVNQTSVLSFSSTRQDNGVALRCEAHLDLNDLQFNVSSQDYNITVQYGPEMHCSTEEFLEGESLEEKCQVTGYPTPVFKWTKDGQPVDPALGLSRNNSGLYTVKAEGVSALDKEVAVFVLYGPELSCPQTYTVLEYAPHNLTCTEPKGFPQPEIIWFKDGEEVDFPDNLTRGDAGQYIITASNKLSSVNLSLDITVLYPPSPIVELQDSEVDVGSTVMLKCSSTGNPRPKYSWDYYRTENVEERNEDGVSFLQIHRSTAYNTGLYKCHAWNDIGRVSETARVTVKGAKQECPIEITLDGMVIQYQEARSKKATCKPTTNSSNVKEIYWQDQQGFKTNTSWTVDTHKDWDLRPDCIGIFQGLGMCKKRLNFTLYKTPDSVSIRTAGDINSVVEDKEFQLQCDITSVAPAQNLIVRWYRGNETIKPLKETTRVTGCLENNTTCNISVTQSPLNVSSIISITMNRTHNGAELRCEVQLDLGPKGPKPAPSTTSSSLNITVYYKPEINTKKLAKRVPVFSGYPEDLVCEADGHPPPYIKWLYSSDKVPHESENNLTVSEAGIYNCTATNEVASVSYEVEVILKEDYLPLIAGFVAVTVIAISVIFVFFYSIYYKNTKMRRYSLKNPKLSTHNGNVAHNGWDLQFPMTTLS